MDDETDSLVRDPVAGANQSGLRDQNARLVLSYLRRHGQMAGAEIARRSGLSAQTVSNILRALEGQELLRRGEAVRGRGKVGKPSVPMELNPGGVYSIGLNIGRRSAELVLVDFHGTPLASLTLTYPYPEIKTVFDFIESGLKRIYEDIPPARPRTTGMGVARPREIWNWLEQVNAPEAAMRQWKNLSLEDEIAAVTGLDVFIENDATSACIAEHLLGRGSEFTDFAHIFVGAFVGGGLVLDGKIIWGPTRNAAALGPLPVPDGAGGVTPLLNVASLYLLEEALARDGVDPAALRQSPTDWRAFEAQVAPWIDKTARNLAIASLSIASVVEVEAILIDGAMPDDVRQRLAAATDRHFGELDLTGLDRPRIETASVGRRARSIGAALLPIHSRFFVA
ncbi:ROK family protein [Alphaproteobacteria bacterium GH1-50]|uniref:ROK family protein n=1 Tax=Kangsaoukella pontilimi TaxID=2691042 RepID=A0A7C9IQR2_9RHOB|nr:ROK family transcriptional regulator [Kangsaoukella pontilimi]MXQ06586.1 ROK family protein [Kangsaoukella pontilimi]